MSIDARRHYEAVERAVRAADEVMDAAGETVLAAWNRIATGNTPVTNAQRRQFMRDVELVVAAIFVSANMSLDQSLLYQVIKREAERVFIAQLKVGLDELDDIMKPYPWWPEQRKRLINAPMSTLQRDRLAQAYQMVYGPHVQRQRLLNARLVQPLTTWQDARGFTLSNRIWMQGQHYRNAIDRTIQRGIREGWSADRMAKELRQYVKPEYAPVRYTKGGRVYRVGSTYSPNAASSARRLARTEITRVHGDGAKERARDVPGLKGIRWRLSLSHPRPDQCDIHASDLSHNLGLGVYPVDEVPPYPDHPQCVLPDANVSLTTAISGMKRWYDGDVVDITTEAGNNLTITPNHPVLTDKGWVAAGLIEEGDYLIGGSLREGTAAAGVPDDDNGPSTAEELFVSLSGSPSMATVSMPSAAEQFHGDGGAGEVNIVFTHGLLQGEVEPSVGEPTLHKNLAGVGEDGASLLGSGAGLQLREAALLPSNGAVGGSSHSHALIRGHSGEREPLGFRPLPDGDPVGLEDAGDNGPADVESTSDALNRDAVSVERENFLGTSVNRVLDIAPHGDAAGFENPDDSVFTAFEMDSALVNSDPGLVKVHNAFGLIPERVSSCHRRSYKGYVYNFETPEQAYISNNIIVHNCMCTLVPVHYPREEVRRDIVNRYRQQAFDEAGFDPETGWID